MAKLYLTEGRKCASCVLASVRFTEGVADITNLEAGLETYLWRSYRAVGPNHPSYAEVVAEYAGGTNEGNSTGDVKPAGEQPSVGDVSESGPDTQPEQSTESAGPTEDKTGTEGAQPVQEPVTEPESGDVEEWDSADPVPKSKLRVALESIDPENDEFWNSSGQVKMDAVTSAASDPTVKRADVAAEWEGFSRSKARAARK